MNNYTFTYINNNNQISHFSTTSESYEKASTTFYNTIGQFWIISSNLYK